ncbi:glycosyltransferase family 4 protein [Oculatella sp. LEGE 06141]|uniref:glycosyltransferase family 4 protein n=1 Tax=Oculatella sp. LEGE 06141 TaxID=1828648 RepID=UPI00188075FB|nr:glycosyltransferase family 4 protein [Oculatella sp. LEGE 06141]MBE9178840.1 glycosyltransferase family 4 protein [Oculatella sp. LEGE 06141]
MSLKVLVSAYACRPGEGSEPGIGWDVVRELAKYHDVWVLTRSNNRPSIEAEISLRPIPGLTFVYLDLPAWARWWKRDQRGVQLHYYLWQVLAYSASQNLHREIHFDLAHHVTYVRYWGPSFVSLLPIPFIWGPVGGGESAPEAFCREFSWRGRTYERMRDLARWLGERDPFVPITAQRSVLARATTEDTARRIRQLGAKTVQVYSQVGLSQAQIDELAVYANGDRPPVRFISIGRLLHWKGFHLGLKAFSQADLPAEAEYWIVGEGPERQRLQALAEQLGIATQVRFLEKLPRPETLETIGQCLALVHPSLHESGGVVCVEAMAAGRPVICLDLGGPAVQVVEGTGFKIPPRNPEQSVQAIAAAMSHLAKDTDLWHQMSQACRKHVSDVYSWTVKGEKLAQLYQDIIDQQKRSTNSYSVSP